MEGRKIVLSSYGGKNPANFLTTFSKPLILDNNYEYVIGLNRIINTSFTWTNINEGYKNQKIKYSANSGTSFTDINFPKGVWTYTLINEYIKEKTVIKSSGKDDEYPINLEFDETTLRVIITLKSNYLIDLTKSDCYELIGFDKKIIKDQVNVGTKLPNVSQDTDMLNIHCDLINNSRVDGELTTCR